MSTNKLSISDAFGFHSTRQTQQLQPKFTYSEARGVTWGYNFRKILSYLPIIATITGIMTLVILSTKKPCALRTGLFIRSILFDLFSLVLLTAIVDCIVSICRKVILDNQIQKKVQP